MLQSVIFDKNIWTLTEARHWLMKHKLRPIKSVHITANYYRFRMNEPVPNARYYTKEIDDGVLFVIEHI